jgi:uncharacterized YccA/Bax inhibitor family protein
MHRQIQIQSGPILALALVLGAIVATLALAGSREQGEILAIVGAVGALILSLLPAIARFSGRA